MINVNSKQPGLITCINPRSPISEQFRSIRTSIEFSHVSQNCNCLVVTSSEPGSGKSTISSNLAISYAQKGKKTLLIDADMRKPKINRIFNLENKRGFSLDLLYPEVIRKSFQFSGIENLAILTSGPHPPNPNELLASKALPFVIDRYRKVFDMIIIDTPPINIVSDASILLAKADGVVLILRSATTLNKEAKKALALIEKFNGNLIGGILNGVAEKNKDDYYYGY